MRQKSRSVGSHGEKVVKDIRRATRKQYSAEEKIRIVLDGPTEGLGPVTAFAS
jgi:transposase